jgi:hypothetical protein
MIRPIRVAAFLFASCLLAGCAAEEKVYQITGTVTYDGKPVPAGLVLFDPEPGTGGAQGSAAVKDGKFATTADGQGIRGGAYTIRVLGFDGKPGTEAPLGNSLFPEYEFKKELPKGNSELNIDVPKKK